MLCVVIIELKFNDLLLNNVHDFSFQDNGKDCHFNSQYTYNVIF